MLRALRQTIASAGAALVATLLSLSVANAQSASDNTQWRNWDEVFAQVLPDKISSPRQTDWLDAPALGYARSARSDAAFQWLPQRPLPAVDGINAKIDGFGGGGTGTNGFYGTNGSLSVPLAQQWGLQLDGGVVSDAGISNYNLAAHLFWRDPSIGLLGAYVSYSHDNGFNDPILGQMSTTTAQYAVEGAYYLSRWTLNGLAGVETGTVNTNVPLFNSLGVPAPSVPNRFFDYLQASYYFTDNFELYLGHSYTGGSHFLNLGGEYGIPLGGGRMAALFAEGWIGEGGDNGAFVGLRIYFGQQDKTLIRRHREDDTIKPPWKCCSPDLIANGIDSEWAAITHFADFGSREGR
jgi:hypothetical protein